MRTKLFNFMLIVFALLISSNLNYLFAQNSQQIRGFGETWVATDALGRSLPTYKDVGPPRAKIRWSFLLFMAGYTRWRYCWYEIYI